MWEEPGRNIQQEGQDADRSLRNNTLDRHRTGRYFSIGWLDTDRGGGIGRQGGNTDSSNSCWVMWQVQCRVTRQAGYTHSQSISKISKSSSATVEGIGLHFVPSNSIKIPSGTDDVASSHTWSEVSSGSGSRMILGTVSSLTGADIVVGSDSDSGSSIAVVVAAAGSRFPPHSLRWWRGVEEYPLHILLKSP